MPKLDLSKFSPVTLALITFVVLAVAVLFAKAILPVLTTTPTNTDQASTELTLNTINVAPDLKNNLGGYKVVLPEGWSVSYGLADTTNSEWECLQGGTCQILVIMSDRGDSKLVKVAVSYPVGVKHVWTGGKKIDKQTVNFAGSDIAFTKESYLTLLEGRSQPVAKSTAQLYGCNSTLICLSSTLFDTDSDISNAQVTEFLQLAKNIKLEKL